LVFMKYRDRLNLELFFTSVGSRPEEDRTYAIERRKQ